MEGCYTEEDELDDDSDYYDSDGNEIVDPELDSFLAYGLMPHGSMVMGPSAPLDHRTPAGKWEDFLACVKSRKDKIFKISDICVVQYNLQAGDDIRMKQLVDTLHLSPLGAGTSIGTGIRNGFLTHCILGTKFLALCNPEQQYNIFTALFSQHYSSLGYLKIGSNDSMETNVHTTALLTAMAKSPLLQMNLNEIEIRGLVVNARTINLLSHILIKIQTLKQLYFIGIRFDESVATTTTTDKKQYNDTADRLDPILAAATHIPKLDELKIVAQMNPTSCKQNPLISPEGLNQLFQMKQKWWRLSLDNCGLNDDHCYKIAESFAKDERTKVGDLLSLLNNPSITQDGYRCLFNVLMNKQRMGLVKVDDEIWESEFSLVRSMNNLHHRLEYNRNIDHEKGSDHDNDEGWTKQNWVEYLIKLSNLVGWEDDKHVLNYIWFTIHEKPEFVEDSSKN